MRLVNRRQLEAFTTLDGSEIREYENTDEQSLAEAIVPAGGATAPHYHRRTEELYLFTAGRGRMKLGDETFDVGAGDCVTIPQGVEHQLWNDAEEPLVLLCCCSPPYSHDDTVLV
jgi:mannose-6-phosphate isomerase-like protein (cupin superfamily)